MGRLYTLDSGIARLVQAQRRSRQYACAECGAPFARVGAGPLYCSGACKQRAYRRRRAERPARRRGAEGQRGHA
jgi:hypothetical protein